MAVCSCDTLAGLTSHLLHASGLVSTVDLRVSLVALGILQIKVNLSPDPTRPGGSELPTFSYGGEGIPRVLKQYRFSPHRYIFPIR